MNTIVVTAHLYRSNKVFYIQKKALEASNSEGFGDFVFFYLFVSIDT
jgi:hypothetical protein